MERLKLFSLLFLCSFLFSCSETKPSGHVYTVNGLGITLPTPDLEMAFLPYPSRADFFHEPISEAYKFATLGLDEALAPLCDEALALVSEEELLIDKARESLLEEGNVPETPDACMNMCLSRVDLEDQREVERKALNKKIAEIDAKIKSSNQKKRELLASRAEKAGELSKSLSKLRAKRNQMIGQKANELLEKQISKLSIVVGETRPRYIEGGAVAIGLKNNSEYVLITDDGWRGYAKIQASGYYKGVKIKDYSFEVPGYNANKNKKDSLGFDKGYSIGKGELVEIGEGSIYNSAKGLSISTPQARLFVQENGWNISSRYIYPDEIRITKVPENIFAVPDEKGVRSGSSITYSPKRVDFREQASAAGMPQDKEIAKISKQISDQSFPEDSQIDSLDNEIAGFRAEQKSARSSFNSSDVAKNIDSLNRSESLCRAASVAMNEIDDRNKVINEWKTDLSSCGTGELDSGAIFSAINSINYDQGDSIIELPEIDQKYAAKARQLIFKKLASEVKGLTRTDINGAFTIDGSVDQSNSMLFAPTISVAGERFWMQPLGSMGDNKNLNHNLISDQKFVAYVNDVIDYSCKDCSIEQFAETMDLMELSAPNPNKLVKSLFQSEILYAGQLAMISSDKSDLQTEEEDGSVLVSAPVDRACKM